MEVGELIHEAAIREVMEEVGIGIEFININNELSDDKATALPTPFHVQLEKVGDHYHEDFVYIARAKDKLIMNKEGHEDIGWFSIERAIELETFDNVKKQLLYIKKMLGL